MNKLCCVAGLLAVASLLSCGEDLELETREYPLTRVCGANKYTGPQGVDVSTYQPNYNWAAQAAAGVRFGYARVSNGTRIIDDQFDRNWPEMKAQGIYRGVYQYFRPGQDAVAQANLVVDRVGMLGAGDMPAMIDVETNDDQPASVVASKVRQWIDIVEAGTGKKPTIYTGAYFWQDFVGDTTLGEYPLFIANYGADCPLVPDGWSTWSFWQYCDGNTAYCTNGMGFDRDVFNGTDEQLDEMAGAGARWGADVVEVAPRVSVEAGELVAVHVVVQNTGSTTWDASTKLGTTEPRDRASAHAAPTWDAPDRVATVQGEVAPGETYRFDFELLTAEPGVITETFGLVQEGVTWFGDQDGPADAAIVIEVDVRAAGADPDPIPDLPDENEPEQPIDEEPPATPPTADGVPPVVGSSPGLDGGCSHTGSSPSLAPLFALLLVGLRRRRSEP